MYWTELWNAAKDFLCFPCHWHHFVGGLILCTVIYYIRDEGHGRKSSGKRYYLSKWIFAFAQRYFLTHCKRASRYNGNITISTRSSISNLVLKDSDSYFVVVDNGWGDCWTVPLIDESRAVYCFSRSGVTGVGGSVVYWLLGYTIISQ